VQRQLERRNVAFHCIVFLRNDIYELLLSDIPDKGKDTAIVLDWDDVEVFKRIVFERVALTLTTARSFDDAWAVIAAPHVGTQDSFSYLVERTLMRPRDLLRLLRRCIEVAVNRGHERIATDDILKAEESYSQDMLIETQFELRDVYKEQSDPLYNFLGCSVELSKDDVLQRVNGDRKLLELLVWLGFLGVRELKTSEPRFSYQVRHSAETLLLPISENRGVFVVHPAFRSALGCT
jgi:hypothetical protein